MSMKLIVGNIADQTSSDDLEQLFAQAGTVDSAVVVSDRDTGRSRGFGYVEMSSRVEGEAAIAQLNGADLAGHSLSVNEAKPPITRAAGASFGNRLGGFGGKRFDEVNQ
jgi:RNA recognition motif-containing protein